MATNWRACVVAVSLLLLALPPVARPAEVADARRPKKLIETGGDQPNTRTLRENLAEIEKRPFNGVVIDVVGQTSEGKPCPMRPAFANEPWQREWFQSCVDDLRACHFQRLTDNFLCLGANPGSVDWFDDAGWKTICDHWRIAAWIAKQGGTKGLLFDPEPYQPPLEQFRYYSQAEQSKHSYEEYRVKARQRGREVMQAIASEYPDMTLFCYLMLSITAQSTGRADPWATLQRQTYSLYPSFIDGWLDVLPLTMTLIDGCESSYLYNSTQKFQEMGVRIKGDCQELISPENRAKYRAQVQVGFGIYMDVYWNPKDSQWKHWYLEGNGSTRVDRLRANVKSALQVADEYVWIYGEKFRWWPTPSGGVKSESWQEALPGCEDALRFAQNPEGYASQKLEEMKQAGTLKNLVRNGDFGAELVTLPSGDEVRFHEGEAPAGWATWQEPDSKGTFSWDREAGATEKGTARAVGVAGGCMLQSYPVQPGQRYVIQASRKLHGTGGTLVRIRWQTADEKWTAEEQDQLAFATGPVGEWANLSTVVQIPEGVGRMVIMLAVRGQKSADDIAWFDDVAVYPLP